MVFFFFSTQMLRIPGSEVNIFDRIYLRLHHVLAVLGLCVQYTAGYS